MLNETKAAQVQREPSIVCRRNTNTYKKNRIRYDSEGSDAVSNTLMKVKKSGHWLAVLSLLVLW